MTSLDSIYRLSRGTEIIASPDSAHGYTRQACAKISSEEKLGDIRDKERSLLFILLIPRHRQTEGRNGTSCSLEDVDFGIISDIH